MVREGHVNLSADPPALTSSVDERLTLDHRTAEVFDHGTQVVLIPKDVLLVTITLRRGLVIASQPHHRVPWLAHRPAASCANKKLTW